MSLYDKAHFRIIQFVHETLYRLFVNPYEPLQAARIMRGQKVLEVGCGPGFFTLPAAEMVGTDGCIFALDINSAAVEHVRSKVAKKGLNNIVVQQADASKTGLPDASIDLAFLFGVVHDLNDFDKVLEEMHRVLKDSAVLAVESSSWSEDRLLEAFTRGDLFRAAGNKGKVYRFQKL